MSDDAFMTKKIKTKKEKKYCKERKGICGGARVRPAEERVVHVSEKKEEKQMRGKEEEAEI